MLCQVEAVRFFEKVNAKLEARSQDTERVSEVTPKL